MEVQVKRGLGVSSRLWNHGVLVVSSDSSRSVVYGLSTGICRVADGRTDDLNEVTRTFVTKLRRADLDRRAGLPEEPNHLLHGLPGDGFSIAAAKDQLSRILLEGVQNGACVMAKYNGVWYAGFRGQGDERT